MGEQERKRIRAALLDRIQDHADADADVMPVRMDVAARAIIRLAEKLLREADG